MDEYQASVAVGTVLIAMNRRSNLLFDGAKWRNAPRHSFILTILPFLPFDYLYSLIHASSSFRYSNTTNKTMITANAKRALAFGGIILLLLAASTILSPTKHTSHVKLPDHTNYCDGNRQVSRLLGEEEQLAFRVKLKNVENTLDKLVGKLDSNIKSGIIRNAKKLNWKMVSLLEATGNLNESDLDALYQSDIITRLTKIIDQVYDIIDDPQLLEILSPEQLSNLTASLENTKITIEDRIIDDLGLPRYPLPEINEPVVYTDAYVPTEERVADLLRRMTLNEKANQLVNNATRISRLGVPAYDYWNECLHGVAYAGYATVFPQAIGMAAMWDAEMMHTIANTIATEGRAKNNGARAKNPNTARYYGLTFWTPNINIFRDPRWGRGQETYGEDPYLAGELAVAFIKGLQGDNPNYYKVMACAKHFAVHSGPEKLRHVFNAEPTSKRDLYETYLPQFERAVK